MKKIIWEVQYTSSPTVMNYCKKCHMKTEFYCSGQFRVNAQQRHLDIWLIYKCSNCGATWNATIYSRVSPQSLTPKLLDCFHRNDKTLAERYAMDVSFLRKNKAEYKLPCFSITGERFPLGEALQLNIKSKYALPLKVSSLIRTKLQLSQKEYLKLIADGSLQSIPKQNLQKSKLNHGILLLFS